MTIKITNEPPPTVVRRGRRTGPTYDTFMELPLDKWATVSFQDRVAASAAASTMRTIARREGLRLSVLTDREDETLLHVLKTKETNDEPE